MNHPAQKKYDAFNKVVDDAQNDTISGLDFLTYAIQNIEQLGYSSTSSLKDAVTTIRSAKDQLEQDLYKAWVATQQVAHNQEFKQVRDYAESEACNEVRKPVLGAVLKYADQKFMSWLKNQDAKKYDPYHTIVTLAKDAEINDKTFLDRAQAAVLNADANASRGNHVIYRAIQQARCRHMRQEEQGVNEQAIFGAYSSMMTVGLAMYAYERNPMYLMIPLLLVMALKLIKPTSNNIPRSDCPSLLGRMFYENDGVRDVFDNAGRMLAPYRIFPRIGNIMVGSANIALTQAENAVSRMEQLTGAQRPQGQRVEVLEDDNTEQNKIANGRK